MKRDDFMAQNGMLKFDRDQTKFYLTSPEIVLGRPSDESAPDVPILDRLVSRRHAVISRDERGYYIRNFGQNGTLVNDKRVEVIYLKDGDKIQIGSTVMHFYLGSEEEPSNATKPVKQALIVDACWEDATLVKDKLAEIDFQCEIVRDGEEAWSKLQGSAFDLVIIDVVVPKLDGFELCRRIRKSSTFGDIPIVVMTHMGHEPEVAHGLQQGADDYIVKPIKPLEFVARVTRVIARLERGQRG